MAIEKGRLRDYGLQSERVLWPTKGPGVFEQEVAAMERAVGLTTLEKAVAWAQTKSMWPDTFGLACCAIQMMSIVSSRYDIARFGMEAFRSSPRRKLAGLGSATSSTRNPVTKSATGVTKSPLWRLRRTLLR